MSSVNPPDDLNVVFTDMNVGEVKEMLASIFPDRFHWTAPYAPNERNRAMSHSPRAWFDAYVGPRGPEEPSVWVMSIAFFLNEGGEEHGIVFSTGPYADGDQPAVYSKSMLWPTSRLFDRANLTIWLRAQLGLAINALQTGVSALGPESNRHSELLEAKDG